MAYSDRELLARLILEQLFLVIHFVFLISPDNVLR